MRTGDPGPAAIGPQRRPSVPRQTLCGVTDCAEPHLAGGYCNTHYKRHRSHGDVEVVLKPWHDRPGGYAATHLAIRRARGAASGHTCACGAPAREWAYDNADPDELVDPGSGCAYSRDITRYRPLCASCHRHLDAPLRKGDHCGTR
ncbi:MAG: hypothetical protein JNM77_08805 [Pseudonocardia sp.]|nr:hypothetical protein [Pseudonocardia sp.]